MTIKKTVAIVLRGTANKIDPKPKRKSRKPKVRVQPAGFFIELCGKTLPAYWNDCGAYLLVFATNDIQKAFGVEIKHSTTSFNEDGYFNTLEIADATTDTEIIHTLYEVHQIVRNAFNQSSLNNIALKLARDNERYAEGLHLNNIGLNEEQRNRVLAAKYPDFDPGRDDIWHATYNHLFIRRKAHGLQPEYAVIKEALAAHGLVIEAEPAAA